MYLSLRNIRNISLLRNITSCQVIRQIILKNSNSNQYNVSIFLIREQGTIGLNYSLTIWHFQCRITERNRPWRVTRIIRVAEGHDCRRLRTTMCESNLLSSSTFICSNYAAADHPGNRIGSLGAAASPRPPDLNRLVRCKLRRHVRNSADPKLRINDTFYWNFNFLISPRSTHARSPAFFLRPSIWIILVISLTCDPDAGSNYFDYWPDFVY